MLLLSVFKVIAVEFVEHNLKTVAVGVSLLVACAVLAPIVYDENYELQIYKLLKAASEGDTKQLKRIENEKYIDINDTDYDTRSALHLAACGGHINAVEFLLNNNAGYLERKDRLHDKGTDMNLSDNDGRTALHAAVERNQEKVVEFLIDKCKVSPFQRWSYKAASYDMTVSDYDKRTALHIAVKNNQEHVVEYLLKECGLTEKDKIAKDRWKTTPKDAAEKSENEIIRQLFKCQSLPKPVTDDKKEFRLLIADVDNDVDTLKRLHENGWRISFKNSILTTVWNVDDYEWNNDAVQYLTTRSKDNNNKHKCAIVTCKKENILRQTQ
ncbi:unnamed protein product [Mytilus edulis]|uniref:Uncharacterized protein n=1 Tax=Mytilus edulis TaxID=6550 RepID=A0A8S3QH66_MYTED|nr:unnamed protein product [Mytilus edulis]